MASKGLVKDGAVHLVAGKRPPLAETADAAALLAREAAEVTSKAEELAALGKALLPRAQGLVVKDEATNAQASELLAEATQVGKALEALRRRFSVPLTDWKKKVDAFFKAKAEPGEKADTLLRDKMLAFFRTQEDERRAEDERRRKEHDAAAQKAGITAAEPPPPPEAAPAVERSTRTEVGTTTVSMVWTATLIDAAAVPREYLCPDEKKVNQAVRDGVRDIPGYRIEQAPSLRQR